MSAEHAEHPALMPNEWPEDPHFGRATSAKVGMWVFLLSDAFMFAGFLLAYGILRGGTDPEVGWIPAGEPAFGIGFTAFLTFLLICSSVTMVLSISALQQNHLKYAKFFLGATIFGGACFLLGQVYEYWGFGLEGHGLVPLGLNFGASHRATSFYCITGFHGMHVFSGVTYLTVIFIRMLKGKYDDGNWNHLETAGLFWHFVDLVWILVFTLVYLWI
ncbi:MAG: cytochrome c oxidase subunit 3 [Acidobacteriota bacterium]